MSQPGASVRRVNTLQQGSSTQPTIINFTDSNGMLLDGTVTLPSGADGAQGQRGDRGLQGIQGERGEQGDRGASRRSRNSRRFEAIKVKRVMMVLHSVSVIPLSRTLIQVVMLP